MDKHNNNNLVIEQLNQFYILKDVFNQNQNLIIGNNFGQFFFSFPLNVPF